MALTTLCVVLIYNYTSSVDYGCFGMVLVLSLVNSVAAVHKAF